MMNQEYQILERAPTLDEYRSLCAAVGWEKAINFDAAPASLSSSLFHALAVQNGVVIGMGRIVGDGAIYFYVQDVAVHPAHQGRGVGRMIMTRLIEYLKVHAPDKAFVGLFAAEGSHALYRSFGFERYDQLTGMFCVTPIE
jgi:ribosomal protein S18 acetylase RimI-like enzyme